jgi:hypothetical protein
MSKQYNTYRNTKRILRLAARCILGVLIIGAVIASIYLAVYSVSCHRHSKYADAHEVEETMEADPITIHIDSDGHDITSKVESGNYQRIEVSDLDMYILSGSLRTLAPNQPLECKKAVICVILNRMKYYKCTLEEIMQQPGQFDDTEQWYYGSACQEDTEAVEAAISDYTIPTTIFYYSLNDYPQWKGTEPWRKIGDYYFSVSTKVFESYNCSANEMVITQFKL